MVRYGSKDLHVEPRKRRYAEDSNPLGKILNRGGGFFERFQKGFSERSTMLFFISFYQLPPEYSLPVVFLVVFPSENHFRTKKQVLIKGVGNTLRELEVLQGLRTVSQIVP